MKAAVWHAKRDIRVEDIPQPPDPRPDEVTVKVHWTGICGSDLHEYTAGPIFIPTETPNPLTGKVAPLVLGHEFSGEIAAAGKDVTNVKVGDLIAGDAPMHCGDCEPCKIGRYNICDSLAFVGLMGDGAFAEYVNIPSYAAFPLPEEVGTDAAALVEPIGVACNTVRRSGISLGNSVAVIGAGPIGLLHLQAAKAAGADQTFVLEIADVRKEFAKNLGATMVLDPNETDVVQAIKDNTGGLGVDVVIECVGGDECDGPTVPVGLSILRRGGRMMVAGIFEKNVEINPNELVFFEKQLWGCLSATPKDVEAAVSLLKENKIQADPMITGRIKVDDIVEKGFEELLANRHKNLKIIVTPQ